MVKKVGRFAVIASPEQFEITLIGYSSLGTIAFLSKALKSTVLTHAGFGNVLYNGCSHFSVIYNKNGMTEKELEAILTQEIF